MTLFHSSVTFAVNLRRTPPAGHILVDEEILGLEQARDLARRLTVACDRLDVLIAANTPDAWAA